MDNEIDMRPEDFDKFIEELDDPNRKASPRILKAAKRLKKKDRSKRQQRRNTAKEAIVKAAKDGKGGTIAVVGGRLYAVAQVGEKERTLGLDRKGNPVKIRGGLTFVRLN